MIEQPPLGLESISFLIPEDSDVLDAWVLPDAHLRAVALGAANSFKYSFAIDDLSRYLTTTWNRVINKIIFEYRKRTLGQLIWDSVFVWVETRRYGAVTAAITIFVSSRALKSILGLDSEAAECRATAESS